jgi:4-diphosphocytidyl-2C-methyl-D-erythritol kinase
MSGSGSTTFALVENMASAESLVEELKRKFGATLWTAVVAV